MKQYNVTITNEDKVEKRIKVLVETDEEFLNWLKLLRNFERSEKISQVKVQNNKEVF